MAPVATSAQLPADVPAAKKAGPIITGTLDFASLKLSEEELKLDDETYEYDYLKPTFPDITWPALEPFEYKDKGLLADKTNNFANLFRDATHVIHLTPRIGTEIYGVKLGDLDDVQKNELALLISTRVAVFFRDQKDFDIRQQLALSRYWGTLHKHATTSVPKAWKDDLDAVHVIWADETRKPFSTFSNTYLWHTDVTYEIQPPSYTTLKVLKNPSNGGDTLWTSSYAVYDALSPGLQQYLEGLTAIHSAHEQASDNRRLGRPVRREPIETVHPIIRTHPVTGYKSVFVNPGFTRSIVGIPKGESDAILKYLFELVATAQDATVRYKWREGDVAMWDNRVSSHSATYGFYPERRHGVRVTTHGEIPVFDAAGKSQQAEMDAAIGLVRNIDGTKGGNYND